MHFSFLKKYRILLVSLGAVSLFATTVFAVSGGPFNPHETLDPDCAYNDVSGTCYVTSPSGGGITIGDTVNGGTANEVLYTNGSGNLASDASFTRTASTYNVTSNLGSGNSASFFQGDDLLNAGIGLNGMSATYNTPQGSNGIIAFDGTAFGGDSNNMTIIGFLDPSGTYGNAQAQYSYDPVHDSATVDVSASDQTHGGTEIQLTSGYINMNASNGFLYSSTSNDDIFAINNDGSVRITDTSGSELFAISTSGNIRFHNAYSFPGADGTSGQVLTTDGSGNLSWTTPATGGGSSLIGSTSTIANETWLGVNAGANNASTAFTTFLGIGAGNTATGADYATFIGYGAGFHATSAQRSIFLGINAGSGAATANDAIFIGNSSGLNDSVDNSSIGNSILIGNSSHTGGYPNSIAIGNTATNTASNQFMVASTYNNWNIGGVSYILPPTQGGAGTALTNDGSGNLSWAPSGGTLTENFVGYGNSSNQLTGTAAMQFDGNKFTLNNAGTATYDAVSFDPAGANYRIGSTNDTPTSVPSYQLYMTTSGNFDFALGNGSPASGSPYFRITDSTGADRPVVSLGRDASGLQAVASTSITTVGDWNADQNSTRTVWNDSNNTMDSYATSTTFAASSFRIANPSNTTQAFFAAGYGAGNPSILLGSSTLGNGTTFQLSDSSSSYVFNKGNFTINSVPYVFPSSQGGVATVLSNDGSGILSWASVVPLIGSTSGSTSTPAPSGFTTETWLGSGAGGNSGSSTDTLFLGINAGYGATGASSSSFIGKNAGNGATGAQVSLFIGNNAGLSAASAAHSIFIGDSAGAGAGTASASIFIGTNAGVNDTVDNTSGSTTSILVGANTSTGGYTNSIALGTSAANTAVNQLMIGSTSVPINTTRFQGSSVGTQCTITTGTGIACTSDERLKTNIADLSTATLDNLVKVRTVHYNLINDSTNRNQVGFLAQDLEQYFPELVDTNTDGYKSVYYAQMTPILTEALRELNLKVISLQGLVSGSSSIAGQFADMVLHVKSIVFGSSAAPSGFTMYDTATHAAYCVTLANGDFVKTAGECATIDQTPVPVVPPTEPEVEPTSGFQEIQTPPVDNTVSGDTTAPVEDTTASAESGQ